MKAVEDGNEYNHGTRISYNKYCLNGPVDSRTMDSELNEIEGKPLLRNKRQVPAFPFVETATLVCHRQSNVGTIQCSWDQILDFHSLGSKPKSVGVPDRQVWTPQGPTDVCQK